MESTFQQTEKRITRKIYLHANFSNHLVELNRQLCLAAAVFALIFTFFFLLIGSRAAGQQAVKTSCHEPDDLAFGRKVAP